MGRSISGELVTNVSVPVTGLSQNPFEKIPGQSVYGTGNYLVFYNNGNFTVPNGVTKIRVRVTGAGGSGAAAGAQFASGGGGGGFAIKEISVTQGESFPVTVGIGGSSVSIATSSGNISGNAGGTSSFGAVLSATGGLGGTASASNVTHNGRSGGVGVGGDYNLVGGFSGGLDAQSTSGYDNASGGGSAATILGNGGNGGRITSVVGNRVSTGGGSVFYNAADRTEGSANGAGCGGSYGEDIFGVFPQASTGGTGYPVYITHRFLGDGLCGGGSGANYLNNTSDKPGGPGAGGGSVANASTTASGYSGGVFGGGGGGVASSTAVYGGRGGLGGGGGGAATSGTLTKTSGAGGNGLVVVEW